MELVALFHYDGQGWIYRVRIADSVDVDHLGYATRFALSQITITWSRFGRFHGLSGSSPCFLRPPPTATATLATMLSTRPLAPGDDGPAQYAYARTPAKGLLKSRGTLQENTVYRGQRTVSGKGKAAALRTPQIPASGR